MSYLNHPDTAAAGDTADTHHLTASAVVLDVTARRVLLVHHLGADMFLFPGGHVEPGEAPHTTAIREVAEETGLTIDLVSPTPDLTALYGMGMTPAPMPFLVARMPAPVWPDSVQHEHTDFLYLATGDSRAPLTMQADEVGSIVWAHVNELHRLNIRAEVEYVTLAALRTLTASPTPGVNTVNVVSGNARVGIQAGVINSNQHR
ncbi:8-oxo-dGTP pyrophosphatase MutT (NUDIX family) [Hamadaea flava]|uniref:NUDIX hydrolase n=1 Tax=Hamadaea flava TaxID=1742688 RepID=A0ABV8LIV9_9ACTN|nr:NUDIX domain-containing protein [Hamadaea flava]MCP2325652.1 8-oxo-dGTP pyrophosphatase MutT (NUDIX family) [Hamadaea flava]